jgi:hypothetical protein
MELLFDHEAHLQERPVSVLQYAAWVKRILRAELSHQQALLVDSLVENERHMPLSKEAYLRIVDWRKRVVHKD